MIAADLTPSMVIPAQAEIQNLEARWQMRGLAHLDSRLRGNDGILL